MLAMSVESAGTMVFVLTLNGPSGRPVSVTASTVDNTATAPTDYSALSNFLVTFPPGQITAQITVQLVNDSNKEADEQFFLSLTSPVNVTLLSNQTAGIITDDDSFAIFMPVIRR